MIQVNLPFLMSNCLYLQIYLILVFSNQDVTSSQNILDFLIWELKWQIENLAWFRECHLNLGNPRQTYRNWLLTSRRIFPKIYYSWQLVCSAAVILTTDKDKLLMLGETGIQKKGFASNHNSSWLLHWYVLIFCNVRECVNVYSVYCWLWEM